MKPEVKNKFVEALRSGDYKQTSGALHLKGDGYCCLGVLCSLAEAEGVVTLANSRGSSYTIYQAVNDSNDASTTALPEAVAEWAGIEITDKENKVSALDSLWREIPLPTPVVIEREDSVEVTLDTLMALNDTGNFTFNQIADIVEEQF